jgi:Transposase
LPRVGRDEEEIRLLFVGDDWAEAHHDVEIQDETGRALARRRLPEGIGGIAALHALLADQLPGDAEPDQVVVGIETDRGPWVQALLAAGYQVYAINPLSASRYLRAALAFGHAVDHHIVREPLELDTRIFPGHPGGRVAGGNLTRRPAGSHRSVREPLGSYGSSHPAIRPRSAS